MQQSLNASFGQNAELFIKAFDHIVVACMGECDDDEMIEIDRNNPGQRVVRQGNTIVIFDYIHCTVTAMEI